ncbi:MAG TPA: ribosome biogenesis GTPase Der [Bacteroidales bacterium]|nr:ribosome biogenesis GTPase Der [Bacteroidales bacterium]HPS18004.1 ribosome biogenesis GTPase Der [Bacteroidales bacterium]
MGNIIAIVGRPNVGKSTLFNRLIGQRQAIVDSFSGVTRDRHYGRTDWNGFEFSVIDTGGYVNDSDDVFELEIKKQVELAIEEASVIVFVVDFKEGLTDMDKDVASILRHSEKKKYLVVNKVDSINKHHEAAEFYQLGLGELYCISAINGSGTGELLDEIVKEFEINKEEEVPELPKFTIAGRPNVGKSSLINALLGEERHIVTPVAGTTRDSIYTRYNKFGLDFVLVDTAGLRKKAKVHEDLEFYSVLRSVRAIENCDVCILMIDATLGFEAQDMNILHLAEKNRKGIVICVNKWDLMEKETNTSKSFEEKIKNEIAPFTDIPIIFISALKKQRIFKALEIANKVYENRNKKIPTSKLNETFLPIIERNPPPAVKGKFVKIKFITQLPTHAPSFAFFCNLPQYIRDSYKRFLENKLRELFDFSGVPIQIFFRKK